MQAARGRAGWHSPRVSGPTVGGVRTLGVARPCRVDSDLSLSRPEKVFFVWVTQCREDGVPLHEPARWLVGIVFRRA